MGSHARTKAADVRMAAPELVPENDHVDSLPIIKPQPREDVSDRVDRRRLVYVHRATMGRIDRGPQIRRWEAGSVGIVQVIAERTLRWPVLVRRFLVGEVDAAVREWDERTARRLNRDGSSERLDVRERKEAVL